MAGDDLKAALSEFLNVRLRFSSATMANMGDISVKKVFSDPKSRIRHEVIAVFSSSEVRDTVRRAAKELAGDPGAGIRLEIPGFLQPSLKALESVSFALKQKNPKMRRNVKFDDVEMNLVLDFSLDPDGGAPWRKIRPAQALAAKSKLKATGTSGGEVNDDELDSMLGSPQGAGGGEKHK